MNKLLKRFWNWNTKRLQNSQNYDCVFIIRNPINTVAFRQSATESGISYKEGRLKSDPESAKVFVCPRFACNDRIPEFLDSITEKCRWTCLIRTRLFKCVFYIYDE